MAGINNLREIYEKRGEEFLNGLLNNFVIINEKVDGAFFGVKKTKDDSFKYFKKSGEITYVDQVLMKYYNQAISHFQNLSEEKRQRIPANLFFGFEYFTKGDALSSKRRDLPKNGLILCYIHKLDETGKVVETLQAKEQLVRWADFLEVEAQPILFEGMLDDEQKTKILEFVYADKKELEEKFKSVSFSKHVVSILCPDIKDEFKDSDLETLIFRFYGNDGENEVFLAKMMDPIFQKRAADRPAKQATSSQDYIWLIVIDLMNHFELYDIDELRELIDSEESYETKYILLINKIFKDFLNEYSAKYDGLVLEIPEYLKRPEFDLDLDLVKDPEVVNLISKNETNMEIYKILLNFFRKVRKKSSASFFTPDMISQLNLIVQKIKNIIMGDAVYEGLFPSFSEFLGLPKDFVTLSETQYAKMASDIVEAEEVNILIGAFQPVSKGHLRAAEEMKKKNGKKTVLVAVKGEKTSKMSPFSRVITEHMLIKVQQKNPDLIADVAIVPSSDFKNILGILRPKYEPALWGTTNRRLKDYALMIDYNKKRDTPLRLSNSFKLVEIPSYIKSEEIFDSLEKRDFEKFKSLVPEEIASEFFNLQKELGVKVPIMEKMDSRLKEDFDKNEDEEIA